MKRLIWFAVCAVLLPFSAGAQAVPAAPSAPAAPAMPVMPPTPPLAPLPPIPAPLGFEYSPSFDQSERMRDAQERMRESQERIRDSQDKMRQAQEDAQRKMDEVRVKIDTGRIAADVRPVVNMDNFKFAENFNLDMQGPVIAGRISGDDSGSYSNGLNAVQQRQYDRAITMFDRVIAQKGSRSDGASYWKAFAQARLVRTEESLATLAGLRRDFPQSRYLGDAKVLEADVRKMSGQKIDPQQLDANDEIKLLAISGIANTDPDRAIPLLEGVLTATNTLTNKKRAIYVLALSEDARAHQILLRYAKGAGNPELQAEAVKYLASRRDSPARNTELKDIYESTQDVNLRRSIIDAYRNAGDKAALLAIARGRTEAVELRRSAINGLQNLAAPPELWALYQQETDVDLRNQMINVFASMGALEQLTQIVKTEKDPAVRLNAVRRMGSQNNDATRQVLADLYNANQDRDTRRAVISAFSGQNNADGLIAIARKENDLELKRDIVKRLSDMAPKNKAAAEFLMEMIK